MINTSHRFHGRSSLQFVYKRGQTVRANQCSLRYVLNPKRDKYRLAVVVSRKVNKSAVVRNRIRRRIYEIVRGCESGIGKPYDMVFSIYDDGLAEMDNGELAGIITGLLKNAGILDNNSPADVNLHGIVKAKEQAG